ncbi:hypothetical protein K456DRAFT_516487 [Colletotrichum gloeosporioides 23]|nr:hypothetical protein K456DRAFT_516487 [Colletotrichum gloeosporioides 23]
MGERTGSRVFQWVWSYVVDLGGQVAHGLRRRCARFEIEHDENPRNLRLRLNSTGIGGLFCIGHLIC